MAGHSLSSRFGAVLCFLSLLSFAQSAPCTNNDYKRYITPCDPQTRTRSVVYYLKTDCSPGVPPPAPVHGLPCDCPPGKGMSGNLTNNKCVPCEIGYYGSGGEIINNWLDWTSNGTVPPKESGIITYCSTSRGYLQECQAWKASSDNFTIDSGDNFLTRCLSSVLLIANKEFVMPGSKVSFEYRVDSRDCRSPGYLGCDGLAFFIDNQKMMDHEGNQFNWANKTYNLTMGIHTLRWVFRKRCFSYSRDSYIDKAFIRSITLVGTVEPTVTCKPCPPGLYSNKKGSSSCTPCSYFQYQSKKGQDRCEICPPNTYAMLGASKCVPLPNCTADDLIAAPGELSTCSCTPPDSTQCKTTVQANFVTVAGLNGARRLCTQGSLSPTTGPVVQQCKCQPGFELKNDGKGNLQCQKCDKGQKSSGVKCETCSAGHVALKGKHFHIWRKDTLPEGFTANCTGDCSVKGGWIPAGNSIRTARVIGNVHSELQSGQYTVGSELAKIVFNCSVNCSLTGVPPKQSRGENLAKIQNCNLIFQVLSANNTLLDSLNCTSPKGSYSYRHETKRDGQIMNHVYQLIKGTYSFRWVFHQEDETRMLSTAFEAKLSAISVLGVPDGQAQNCTACPAGYHSILGNTDCKLCPNGTASSSGAEMCKPCDEGYFAAQNGSETCLKCGNNTKSLPNKDGCSTEGCKFSPAPGVEYDLSKLSRPGGPMIEVVLENNVRRPVRSGGRSRRRSVVWPYRPSLYVNLCTVDHDNSSCTYRDGFNRFKKIPRPVMACRTSWYMRDTDLGSVIGYSAKDDVRSGLFVELLHGDRCYSSINKNFTRYSTLLDLRCDVNAGVGNPGRETKFMQILRDCRYHLVWYSLYACPKCHKSDVTKIVGECINGTRNITYMRSVPCWGTGEDTDVPTAPASEECVTPTVTVRVPVSGTVAYVVEKSNKVNMALIGVGVVIIVALIAVAVFFVYKHRVMKYRYYTMMARNKPMSRLEQEDDENTFIQDDELAQPYDSSVRT